VKKYIFAILMCFACVFMAKSYEFPPMPVVVYPEILQNAIKKNFTVMDFDNVYQEFERRVDDVNSTVNTDDIKAMCEAGRVKSDSEKCMNFRNDLMTTFYQVCEEDAPSGKSECVDDFWGLGIRVRLPEAIGISKEYAWLKNKQKIACENQEHAGGMLGVSDYIKCVSDDKKHFYEFKYYSTTERKDIEIIKGTLRAIGKLHNVGFHNPDCFLPDMGQQQCHFWYETKDEEKCKQIDNSLSKFGFGATVVDIPYYSTKWCKVYIFHSGTPRSAYGINNKAFKDIQVVYTPDVHGRIKAYVKKELAKKNIKLETFYCNASTQLTSTNSLDTKIFDKSDRDEYLTCYVNGQPIDFLFDDLSEGAGWTVKSDLSKMACSQIGGKVDGRDCRGLIENECYAISNKIPGGTRWDPDAEVCVLNNADIAKKINDRTTILAGLVLSVEVGVAAGAKTMWVLVAGSGSVLYDATFISLERQNELKPKERAYDFVNAALACHIPVWHEQCDIAQIECAKNVINRHFASLDEIFDDLNDEQMESVIDAMENVTGCLSDEQFSDALQTSTLMFEDKVLKASSWILVVAGIFIDSNSAVSKLAKRAPKLIGILSRCHVVEGTSKMLDGARYTRIYVDKLKDDKKINRLIDTLQSKGLFISAGIADDGRRFIAVSDKNNLEKLGKMKTNWFFKPIEEKFSFMRKYDELHYVSYPLTEEEAIYLIGDVSQYRPGTVTRIVPVEGTRNGRVVLVVGYESDLEKVGEFRVLSDGTPEYVIHRDNSEFLRKAKDLTGKSITKIGDTPVYLEAVGRYLESESRAIAIVRVGNKKIPFYVSTGTAGKTTVPTGKWEAFFVLGGGSGGNWFNKGNLYQIEHHYDSPELKHIADVLDAKLGDPRNVEYMLYTAGRQSQGGTGFVGVVDNLNMLDKNYINSGLAYTPSQQNVQNNIEDVKNYLHNISMNKSYTGGARGGNNWYNAGNKGAGFGHDMNISSDALKHFKAKDNKYQFDMGVISSSQIPTLIDRGNVLKKWGITGNANEDIIKKRYHELQLKFHPDINPDFREEAEEILKNINREKEILDKTSF